MRLGPMLEFLKRATGIGYHSVPVRMARPEIQRSSATTRELYRRSTEMNKELKRLNDVLVK